MKKLMNRKTILLLIAATLILGMAIGGTVAYLAANTDPVVNTFTPGNVDITVDEEFDGKTKSNVMIKNTGTVDAYIRAKVVITWQDANGNVYGTLPVANTDYTIAWGSGWDTETADGFYYHTAKVAPDKNTSVLITSCTPKNTAPEGYNLHVEILAQAIQAEPTSVVEDEWDVTVADDGTISK